MLLITITNYNKGVYLMQLLDSLYKQIDENVKVFSIERKIKTKISNKFTI